MTTTIFAVLWRLTGRGKMLYAILVVGDDEQLLGSFTENLKEPDYRLEMVQSGKEALKKIKAKRYDLVVADMALSDGSATLVCAQLQKEAETTRCIKISSSESPDNDAKRLDLDCFGWVDKPFDWEYMKELVRQALVRNNESLSQT
jgi:DNA-binding NtrC family response regulator